MNNIQKRWDRHYEQGCATAYFIDPESPIYIFDSTANDFVNYCDLPFYDQNVVDIANDIFEEGHNHVIALGGKLYEKLNYNRFSLLREIEGFGDTIYCLNDFKEE